MIALAGTVALAGSVFLAALRLLIQNNEVHGRSYIFITPAYRLYLLFHGFAALPPLLICQFWPKNWSPFLTFSPWLVAIVAPLVVNQMVKVRGLGFPEATGRLSRFRGRVSKWIERKMIDEEFAAMRRFIAPFAKGMDLLEIRALVPLNIPLQLPADKAEAVCNAVKNAKTVEQAMELYIRHIGRESFLSVFKQNEEKPMLAPLPLFDEWERRRHTRAQSSDSLAASA